MDELMKQAEDHLAKGRVQVATDEAVLGIKRDKLVDILYAAGWRDNADAQHTGILAAIPAIEAALSSNAAQSAGQEPVAVVCECFEIRWAGSGPIAPIVERNGIKVGTKLYTHPSSAAQVADLNMHIENVTRHINDGDIRKASMALVYLKNEISKLNTGSNK